MASDVKELIIEVVFIKSKPLFLKAPILTNWLSRFLSGVPVSLSQGFHMRFCVYTSHELPSAAASYCYGGREFSIAVVREDFAEEIKFKLGQEEWINLEVQSESWRAFQGRKELMI